MKKTVDELEMHRLNPVMHVDAAKSINRVNDEYIFTGLSITGEAINCIFSLPELIITLFQSLAYFSKKIVTDTIEGKFPLMYWDNSVASQASGEHYIPITQI